MKGDSMDEDTKRAIEFERLITRCQSISTEVMAMRWANEQDVLNKNMEMSYGEIAFREKAAQLFTLSNQIGDLAKE